MNNELIERYIYAVTKRLPKNSRSDVGAELETLISDMINERCVDISPSEKDVKVILTELGTPEELYQKYNPDGNECLIGQPYFSTYKMVLKIVLACMAFGMIVASLLSFLVELKEPWYLVTIRTLGSIIAGEIFAFSFVTLLFSFFSYKGIKIDSYTGLENLPPVPKNHKKNDKADAIVGIVFSIIFMILFLMTPQVFSVVIPGENLTIPVFNIEVLRGSWYLIMAFGLLGIIRETVRLIDVNKRSIALGTTLTADFLSAIIAFLWLSSDKLVNSEFTNYITGIYTGDEVFISKIFENSNFFLMGIIIFAIIVDALSSIIKEIRHKKDC